MADAIGRAVGRTVRALPTPTWLFMKSARLGVPIDLMSGVRWPSTIIDAEAFEDRRTRPRRLDVTANRRKTSKRSRVDTLRFPQNQRTARNRIRQFAEFMIAPLRRGFDFEGLRSRVTPAVSLAAAPAPSRRSDCASMSCGVTPLILLVVGLVAFRRHPLDLTVAPTFRDGMAARLGALPWRGLYSFISIAGFALLIAANGVARHTASGALPPAVLDALTRLRC